ncbi:MAG: FIST C-terminal domain-containing protein [Myxococcota bacterium]|nr:FIST C-terminal domain-containing protein [Deltaproteobacteria bacterium]MDQ3337197.1 FIST C-terminal domain-containing protein [Myxococcota bacterium]
MTRSVAVYTTELESTVAGQDLGKQVREKFGDERPDAVIVFASARYDYEALLQALNENCRPVVLVGSSSAGEFTSEKRGEGAACALALRSTEMRFSAGLGRGVGTDREGAVTSLLSSFAGLKDRDFHYRAALVMTDALAGHADDLIDKLTIATSGGYEFAGGGAGDDAKFARTHVFYGTQVVNDAVVALEILSKKPMGIGVYHGWTPASEALRVTQVEGARLIGLDGFPAVEAFEQHAERTQQKLDRSSPLPFFLHNILGIDTPTGHRLRVPLSIDADGGVTCAAEIPTGAKVYIMKASSQSATEAAAEAARAAMRAIGGAKPAAALFFDCVATRLRMGDVFGSELQAVHEALGGSQLVGCNTYGQIARADGQFSGFHNCTAVVLALPE